MHKTESQYLHSNKRLVRSDTQTQIQKDQSPSNQRNQDRSKAPPQEIYRNLRNILSASIFSTNSTVLSEIEAAEKLGNCVIDFQI